MKVDQFSNTLQVINNRIMEHDLAIMTTIAKRDELKFARNEIERLREVVMKEVAAAEVTK